MNPQVAAFAVGVLVILTSTGILGIKLGYAERDLRLARAETAQCLSTASAAKIAADQRMKSAALVIKAAREQTKVDTKLANKILEMPIPADPDVVPTLIDLIESERKDAQ
jgi:hypothetical protein